MVKLSELPKIHSKKPKRVGRGWGSGKGKYSGRGNKGQKSREKIKWLFEGGQARLNKHLPMIRGKGKNKSIKPQGRVLNVSDLESNKKIKSGAVIDKTYLIKNGLLEKGLAVKLLGKGKLTKKLTVKISMSQKAAEKVNKANQ
jgi:large subunit ribosomal protein L15